MRFVGWSSLLACGALAACAPCDREGCHALQKRQPSPKDVSRIAGSLASKSDVVTNGCQECVLSDSEVRAWSRATRVADADELAAALEQAPDGSTTSEQGKYALTLSPGDYLVCFGSICFETSVVAGGTTTLNVRVTEGPARGYLALPGAAELSQVQELASWL